MGPTKTALALVYLAQSALSHEFCLDSTGPSLGVGVFTTCPEYNGVATCLSPGDEAAEVAGPLAALGLAAGACRDDVMRPLLCARVDPWAAHLYEAEAGPAQTVPILCDDFAREAYTACAAQVMTDNPFLTGAATGSIASEFASEAAFVAAFVPPDSTYCFAGEPFTLPAPVPFSGDEFLCLERMADNPGWINMVAIPGFADLFILGTKAGATEIMRVRAPGLEPVFLGPMVDLTSQVDETFELGLLGIAFHKSFPSNGRVFFSYSCGNVTRCGAIGTSVVEEFVIASPTDAMALTVSSIFAGRVVMNVAQPYDNHNGGQLLFSPSPADPNLYWFMGDGGWFGDPENRAQNMTSPLGKVLRIDIDSAPTGGREYAIPADNPFVALGDAAARPEIWALGLRNPWRCSFDRDNAVYLYCGDVGQNNIEEVSIIAKGGNYGWRRHEGTANYGGGTPLALGMTHTPPVIQYTHTFNDAVAASVTGGYMYRGARVPELQGSYIFADLYDRLYVSRESPPLSGNFDLTRYGYECSLASPGACGANVSFITTFGEDSDGELYFTSETGVYRVLEYAACLPPVPSPTPPSATPSAAPVAAPVSAGSAVAVCALFAAALSALAV